MASHSAMRTTPQPGVLRLVVLALTLAGFVAMHALTSSGGDGTHCGSPGALLTPADPHHALDAPATHPPTAAATHIGVQTPTPDPGQDVDDLVTGCLLALLGALVAMALRLLGRVRAHITSLPGRRAFIDLRVARAPPDPLFLSLCVFRL